MAPPTDSPSWLFKPEGRVNHNLWFLPCPSLVRPSHLRRRNLTVFPPFSTANFPQLMSIWSPSRSTLQVFLETESDPQLTSLNVPVLFLASPQYPSEFSPTPHSNESSLHSMVYKSVQFCAHLPFSLQQGCYSHGVLARTHQAPSSCHGNAPAGPPRPINFHIVCGTQLWVDLTLLTSFPLLPQTTVPTSQSDVESLLLFPHGTLPPAAVCASFFSLSFLP